jgi:pimeloyl-ACP methyl ester carboxylesterase
MNEASLTGHVPSQQVGSALLFTSLRSAMYLLTVIAPLKKTLSLVIVSIAAITLSGCATQSTPIRESSQASSQTQLVVEEFMIPSADKDIKLYVRNKRLPSMTSFNKDNVLLFVHGATYPSETGFDLKLDDLSWMDVLAQQGFDVYMVDVRGYGKSTRPATMDQPAGGNRPIADTNTAALDYAAAADWVRNRRSVEKINVLGHSWGTAIAALYTSRHSDKVNRLVLYAPVWLRKTASLTDAGGELGSYRTVTIDQARKRKDTGLKAGQNPQPDAWFEIWAKETFASDPVGSKADPKFVRAPNGSVQDSRIFWSAGKPVYDPALIKVPTMLILAEWDADTPLYMAETLFPLLTNANPKKLVILSEGTHSIMNEVKRFSLFNEVSRFYKDGVLP